MASEMIKMSRLSAHTRAIYSSIGISVFRSRTSCIEIHLSKGQDALVIDDAELGSEIKIGLEVKLHNLNFNIFFFLNGFRNFYVSFFSSSLHGN